MPSNLVTFLYSNYTTYPCQDSGGPPKNKLESDKIVLDPDYPDRTVSIGSDIPIEIRPDIVSFLKGKVDNFAWSHLDMTGISPDIITHKLNIDLRV